MFHSFENIDLLSVAYKLILKLRFLVREKIVQEILLTILSQK